MRSHLRALSAAVLVCLAFAPVAADDYGDGPGATRRPSGTPFNQQAAVDEPVPSANVRLDNGGAPQTPSKSLPTTPTQESPSRGGSVTNDYVGTAVETRDTLPPVVSQPAVQPKTDIEPGYRKPTDPKPGIDDPPVYRKPAVPKPGVVTPTDPKRPGIPQVDDGGSITGGDIDAELLRLKGLKSTAYVPPADQAGESGGGTIGRPESDGGGIPSPGAFGGETAIDGARVAVPDMRSPDAVEQAKERSAVFLSQAETAYKMGDFEAVVKNADASLQLFPNARALTLKAAALGRLAGMRGRGSEGGLAFYRRSEAAALDALKMKDQNPAALEALAWAQLNQGHYQDAAASASQALGQNPDSAMAHAIRAYALEGLGRREEMLSDIEEAARLDAARFAEQARIARAGGRLFDLNGDDGWQLLEAVAGRRGASGPGSLVLGAMLLAACGLVGGGAWLLWGRRAAVQQAAPVSAVVEDSSGLLAGKYQLTRIIGKGGMGQVWEAQDRSLDRIVAIKKMSIEGEFEGKARELYLKEARTLAALHHPNIVDIYEILDLPKGLYLIFELLSGKTVQQMLAEQKRLSFYRSREILRPVCDALEFAHGRAVVHRDLKPSNIMVTEQGYVKVMDFGIARSIGDHHGAASGPPAAPGNASPLLMARTQTVAGTPAYMAPEAAGGTVSPASDVYALGVCLYEMVTGELPFGLQGFVASRTKTFVPASARVPGVAREVDALLARSITAGHEERMKSAREFREALDAVRGSPSPA